MSVILVVAAVSAATPPISRPTPGRSPPGSGPDQPSCSVASLAACLLKNIERYSEMLPFRYEVASVEVVAERQDSPPRMTRMRYRIEIVTDEPQQRVGLLHRNIRRSPSN